MARVIRQHLKHIAEISSCGCLSQAQGALSFAVAAYLIFPSGCLKNVLICDIFCYDKNFMKLLLLWNKGFGVMLTSKMRC